MSTEPEQIENESGQYAFDGLDRVLHEKARLGILTSLLAHRDGLIFNELRDLCTLTDGNLSRHLSILQDASLIEMKKSTKGNRPQTTVTLTTVGKQRFLEYLAVLEEIVNRASAPRIRFPFHHRILVSILYNKNMFLPSQQLSSQSDFTMVIGYLSGNGANLNA